MRLDPGSAVETYGRALAVDNSLSNVWFNLANAYLKLGEEEEAARWLVLFSTLYTFGTNNAVVKEMWDENL